MFGLRNEVKIEEMHDKKENGKNAGREYHFNNEFRAHILAEFRDGRL